MKRIIWFFIFLLLGCFQPEETEDSDTGDTQGTKLPYTYYIRARATVLRNTDSKPIRNAKVVAYVSGSKEFSAISNYTSSEGYCSNRIEYTEWSIGQPSVNYETVVVEVTASDFKATSTSKTVEMVGDEGVDFTIYMSPL